jgi:hypothetical protein
VRKNETAWEATRVAEIAVLPVANESAFRRDGCESLGQVVGAQGVLTQPE